MKQPTINDVAQKAGVSKSLVSLVMRGAPNVSEARRTAVLEAADRLGYRPNAAARSLVRRRSGLIGVMVSDFHNPFFAEVLDGVEAAADTAGYKILTNSGQRVAAQEAQALETLLELRTDALILASPVVANAVVERAARAAPTVIVGKVSRSKAFDSVANDERAGSRLAVEHLKGLGHTRIAHIDGGRGGGARPRRNAYEAAMKELGLGRWTNVVDGEFTEEAGFQGARELFKSTRPPTAIFAANDLAAIGAIQALEEMGLNVPRDVSVIGYDNTHISALGHISLSTIDQPRFEIGRRATQLLVDRLESGRTTSRRVVVQPSLVPRSTTAPPQKGKK